MQFAIRLLTEHAPLHHVSPDKVSTTAAAPGDVHQFNTTAMQVIQAAACTDHRSHHAATAVTQLPPQTANHGS